MSIYTRSRSCYIMVVPSGYVKVGVSGNVERRRGAIQASCYEPVDIYYSTLTSEGSPVDPFELERLVHQKLSSHAARKNEWFLVDAEAAMILMLASFRFLAMPVGHPWMLEKLCANFAGQSI